MRAHLLVTALTGVFVFSFSDPTQAGMPELTGKQTTLTGIIDAVIPPDDSYYQREQITEGNAGGRLTVRLDSTNEVRPLKVPMFAQITYQGKEVSLKKLKRGQAVTVTQVDPNPGTTSRKAYGVGPFAVEIKAVKPSKEQTSRMKEARR